MYEEVSLAAANAERKPLHWLLEAGWFDDWRAYVGLDSVAPATGAAEPDKFTNESITDVATGMLNPSAQKDRDFVLVPNAVWRSLSKVKHARAGPGGGIARPARCPFLGRRARFFGTPHGAPQFQWPPVAAPLPPCPLTPDPLLGAGILHAAVVRE